MGRRNRMSQQMLTVSILTLVACTGGTVWTHPGFGPEMQQRQFTLASIECMARANQLIHEPQRPQQPYSQSKAFGAESVCGSFMACWDEAERKSSRDRYARDCLEDRGWQQHSAGQ